MILPFYIRNRDVTAKLAFYILSNFLPCLQNVAAQELTVVSPHWEGMRHEFAVGFNKLRTRKNLPPVHFRFLDVGGTANIVRYIQSSFSGKAPDQDIGVDLFWGGSVDAHDELRKAGQLEQVLPNAVEENKIPAQLNGIPLYDPQHYWFGSMLAGFGIYCNKNVLERLQLPLPQSWSDLANPKYKSWIGAANPANSGSAHMSYEIILQAYGWNTGWDLLESISRNVRFFSNFGAEVPQDVSNGELACGFSIDSTAEQQIKIVGPSIGVFILPNDAALLSPDIVSIIKNAPQRALAKEFLDFLLSEDGQKLLLLPAGTPEGPDKFTLMRYAIRPDAYQSQNEILRKNPFERTSTFSYTSQKGAIRWQLVNDLFQIALIDIHKKIRTGFKPEIKSLVLEDAIPEYSKYLSDKTTRMVYLNKLKTTLAQRISETSTLLSFKMALCTALLLLLIGSVTRGYIRLRRSSRS